MRTYEFPASCSPEEGEERLTQRVREEQAIQLARKEAREPWAELKLKWRTELEFDLRWIERKPLHNNSEVWAGAGPDGCSLEAGTFWRRADIFSETFRGRLEPDGLGASVLQGHFRIVGASGVFLAFFGLGCAALALLAHMPLLWLGTAVAAVSLFWHLRHQDSYPASQTILAFLEDVAVDREVGQSPFCVNDLELKNR